MKMIDFGPTCSSSFDSVPRLDQGIRQREEPCDPQSGSTRSPGIFCFHLRQCGPARVKGSKSDLERFRESGIKGQ